MPLKQDHIIRHTLHTQVPRANVDVNTSREASARKVKTYNQALFFFLTSLNCFTFTRMTIFSILVLQKAPCNFELGLVSACSV